MYLLECLCRSQWRNLRRFSSDKSLLIKSIALANSWRRIDSRGFFSCVCWLPDVNQVPKEKENTMVYNLIVVTTVAFLFLLVMKLNVELVLFSATSYDYLLVIRINKTEFKYKNETNFAMIMITASTGIEL